MRTINRGIMDLLFEKKILENVSEYIVSDESMEIEQHEPSEYELRPDRATLDKKRLFDIDDSYRSMLIDPNREYVPNFK